MKKFFHYLLLSVAMVVTFTACSDDDDPYFQLPKDAKTLNSSNGFTLTSNGKAITDAHVQYSLAADGKTVTLNVLGANAGRADSDIPEISAGDVLPGCADVTLTFAPTCNATDATFTGQGTATYCSFNYAVTITATTIDVRFTDIVMNTGVLVSAITFTDSDVDHLLELTYNGAPLMGKVIDFVPSPNDYRSATLTLAGLSMDLSALSDVIGDKLQNIPIDFSKLNDIKTPGVLPGTPVFNLDVTLDENNQFQGESATDFVNFKYSGTVAAGKLTLNITDATLKNTAVAGKYDLNDSNPMRIIWASTKTFPAMGNWAIGDALQLILLMGVQVDVDGTKMTIDKALTTVLKSVTLGADGTVSAEYADTKVSGLPVTTSAPNLAHYVVTSDNEILLFLNPQAIIASAMAAATSSKADANASTVDQLLAALLPKLATGFTVHYGPMMVQADGRDEYGNQNWEPSTDTPDVVSFYLGTESLVPYLKALAPVLAQKDVQDKIIALATQDPSMGGLAGVFLPMLLPDIPGILENTTNIEVGMNLKKAAQ